MSRAHLRLALAVSAGLPILGMVPAWFSTRTPPGGLSTRPILLHPARHSEWAACSPQRLFHYLTWDMLKQLRGSLRPPFGLFLAAWLLSFGGSTAVFSLYPVLMEQVFGVRPVLSSWAFGAAAGLGLVSIFLFVVLAWSLLSVSGTALAAKLSPVGEGKGMGLFNATTAVAGVVGSVLGGWIAGHWGYLPTVGVAVIGTAIGSATAVAIRSSHLQEELSHQRSERPWHRAHISPSPGMRKSHRAAGGSNCWKSPSSCF